MKDDLRLRELSTAITFGGKSLKEAGFPEEWEYNPYLGGWERAIGEVQYFLSRKHLCEIRTIPLVEE